MAIDYQQAARQHSARSLHAPAAGQTESPLVAILAWTAAILSLALFNDASLERLSAGEGAVHGRESGPLENAQLIALLAALLLFGLAGLKGRGAVRVAGCLLGLLTLFGFLRELDLKALAGPSQELDWYIAHGLQRAALGTVVVVSLVYSAWHWRCVPGLARLALRWQAWPCSAAFVLLAAAEIFLDGVSGPDGHFWEELVEFNGYFLLAVAAWRHACLIGDPKFEHPL